MSKDLWLETEALVLSGRNLDDADRLLWLFTKQVGLVQAVASGTRRSKSSWSGMLQPFSHVHVSLQEGHWFRVKQCELIKSYGPIQLDINRLAYASFVSELTHAIFPQRQQDENLFELLVAIFEAFVSRNPRVMAQISAWQLLREAGLAPLVEHCTECGQGFSYPVVFSPSHGGVLCGLCRDSTELELTERAHHLLQAFLELNLTEPPNFSLQGKDLLLLERILFQYLAYHVGEPLKSLAFIQQVISNQ